MDNWFQIDLSRLSALATAGPLVIPIWVALIFFILSFFRGPMLKAVFQTFGVKNTELLNDLRKRVDIPVQLLFISLALSPFTILVRPPFAALCVTLAHLVATFLLFHILIQFVDLMVFSWYTARKGTNVSAVVRFFVLSVLYAIAVMLLLDWDIGVSVLPLLATSTVLTAVLGLALQDTLKNAFAGLNMSLEHSFEQGDWIMFRLDANDQWFGQIVEIGWRTTKIKTLNNNYAVIPNATFTSHELINFNKPSPVHGRTVEIPVGLRADAENVRIALIRSALACEGVLEDPRPEAQPIAINTTHVLYQLRFWLTDIAQREIVTGRVLEKIWLELKEQGALP